MENTQLKSSNKRSHGEHDSAAASQCKLQRLESCGDEETDKAATITDCDDICLVKMFDHLSLIDLLNVADANKLLVPAARHAYKCKFGTKMVQISGCDDLRPNTRGNARTGHVKRSAAPRERIPNSISIRHLKPALRFLRCFGPTIKHLSIYYNKSKSQRYQYVHQYTSQYCAENLLEISLHDLPNIKIQHLNDRPFTNVTCLNIFGCHLGKQLPSLAEWFPNLRSLKLSKIQVNHRFVNAKFHNLENVEIFCKNDTNGCFAMNDIAAFLRSNRQLRTISITSVTYLKQFSLNILLDIIQDSKSIEKLVVRVISETMLFGIKRAELDRIVNEHPALIELDLLFSHLKIDDVIMLLRELKSLKKLNFLMFDPEYEKLQLNLGDGWASHSHKNFVTVQRKQQS